MSNSTPDSTTRPGHLNHSRVLGIIGAALVASAYFAIIINSWPTLSAPIRVLLIAVPHTVLFLLYFLRSQKNWQDISDTAFALGLLLLPATIATALYQFKVLPEINGDLALTSTLISLPAFLWADYRLKEKLTAHLTVINLIFIGLLTLARLNWSDLVEAFLATGVGLITLLLAVSAQIKNIDRYYRVCQLYATAILLFALPMLVDQLFSTSVGADLSIQPPSGLGLIQGVAAWLVALSYVRFFHPLSFREVTFQRFWLVVGSLSIIFASTFSITTVEQVMAFLASLSVILLGLIFSVNLVFSVGVFGLVVSVLSLATHFAGNVSLPIIMLLGGLILIGLSILANRGRLLTAGQSLALPALNRIGVVSDTVAHGLPRPANQVSWSSFFKVIILGFLGLMLLSILFSLLLAGMD